MAQIRQTPLVSQDAHDEQIMPASVPPFEHKPNLFVGAHGTQIVSKDPQTNAVQIQIVEAIGHCGPQHVLAQPLIPERLLADEKPDFSILLGGVDSSKPVSPDVSAFELAGEIDH